MIGTDAELLTAILEPSQQHEAVALARALCPFADTATDVQMLLCIAMVEAKGDVKLVAEATGYDLARVRSHLQCRLAEQIIRTLARQKLSGEGYLIAVSALLDVASSQSQTGNARRQASEAIIALVDGDKEAKGAKEGDGLNLNEMTIHQLERFVGAIKQDMLRIATLPSVIEG